MEVFAYVPEFIWIASLSFLGGTLAVLIAHRLSVQERRYNRKLDALFQITRNLTAHYYKERKSLTYLDHSLNDAMIIFSSKKIRLAIDNVLSEKGETVSIHKVHEAIKLMCKDIDPTLEYRIRN
ncbi:MAG: hypothetical protein OXI44_01395 [Bacteroidota bacterium]|nr:hypothetical protein [Bacteroidota bacterium]